MTSSKGLLTDIETSLMVEPKSASIRQHPHPGEKADLASGYF